MVSPVAALSLHMWYVLEEMEAQKFLKCHEVARSPTQYTVIIQI